MRHGVEGNQALGIQNQVFNIGCLLVADIEYLILHLSMRR